MNTPKALLAVFSLLGCFRIQAGAAAYFTVDPEKTVIVSEGNPEATKELKIHLETILGTEVRVVPARNAKVDEGVYVWRVAAPTREEYAIESSSWEVTEKGAVFRGVRRYAVCDYFESKMGVRYPWGEIIAWHGERPVRFATGKGSWIPALRIRNMRGKGEGLDWRFRLRDGSHDRPQYGHAFTRYWGRYSKTRPEFFAMRPDGKRLPIKCDEDVRNRDQFTAKKGTKEAKYIDHMSMCPSCEGLSDQLVEDWKNAGAKPYLNACENDSPGTDVCHCEGCRALDEPKPEGASDKWPNWYADRYVVFVKKVLEKARRIRPDVKVVMYAYNATEAPPRREKLDKDIIVGMVPTYFGKKEFSHYIQGWKDVGMKDFFVRSNRRCYFNASYTPVGWERHFFDLCIYAQKEGAIGFDYDGRTPKKRCPAQWLCDYVVHKAMQDPGKPFEYWMRHYCEAFGAAADDVYEYFRYWREEVFEKRILPDFMKLSVSGKYFNFTRGLFWKLGDYYKAGDYHYALSVLDKALSRPGLGEADRDLVRELKFTTEHALLIYRAVVAKRPFKAPYARELYDFRVANDMQIMPHYESYWGDLTAMRAYDKYDKLGIAAKPTELYLLAGQSNMAGRGRLYPTNRVDCTRVLKFSADRKWHPAEEPLHFDKPHCAGAGLGASFARTLADRDGKAVIGLVPCAMGGSSIGQWAKGGTLYTNAVSRVKAAMAGGAVLKGILWHQGETDAQSDELVAAYAARLEELMRNFRAEFGCGDVPIVMGKIKSLKTDCVEGFVKINEIIARVASRLPNAVAVGVEDMQFNPDKIHYDTGSLRKLGVRYAEAMEKLQSSR